MDSRHLLYEAQQAFYYGLPHNLALSSVISNSAEVMGMGHRIGYVKEGYDAGLLPLVQIKLEILSDLYFSLLPDLVIWDSHPLALGATPKQVFIDGIPQIGRAFVTDKPENFQRLPKVPNFGREAERAVAHDGLPPLEPRTVSRAKSTVFLNVKRVLKRDDTGLRSMFGSDTLSGVVVVEKGRIVCAGNHALCGLQYLDHDVSREVEYVDLEGGSIAPGLVTFGSPVGLEQINEEPSTNDGSVYDQLTDSVPALLGGHTALVRAADGLDFGSRDAL